MIYDYYCPECVRNFEITKSHEYSDWIELCRCCGTWMEKRFNRAPYGQVDNFQPHFNHAFGKKLGSKRAMMDEVHAYKERTGRELEPIGTDTLKDVKMKLKPIDMGDVRLGDVEDMVRSGNYK